MQISAKELRHLANDVDDQHHQAMRTFTQEASELHLSAARGRRRFLKQTGIAAVGGTLLTAGGGLATFTRLGGVAAAQDLSDTQIAGYAQGIELAAVAAYEAAAPKLSGDVLAVAQLFAGHHGDHAEAFGAVAGDDAQTEPNPKLVEAVTPTLQAVGAAEPSEEELTSQILAFARDVENQAAYTYAAALTLLRNPAYAAATSTILPIEAQHATVLTLALGGGPDDLFPTGAFESAAPLGDGTDTTKGFDPAVFGPTCCTHERNDTHMDLNRDELRRELRAIDADNQAAMPRWYVALRQIVGGGSRMSAEEKAAALGVPAPGRRSFLKVGGVTILGAAVLAACGDDDSASGGTASTGSSTTMGDAGDGEMDLALARTAASLEQLVVDTYQTGIDSGLVTTMAIAEAATLFQAHHREHLDALNGAIKGAGGTEVTEANEAVYEALVKPAVTAAKAEADIVKLAFDLESAAAQTYAFAGGTLSVPALRSTIMTIGGIEARHAAILQVAAQGAKPADVFPDGRAFYPGDNPLEGIDGAVLSA